MRTTVTLNDELMTAATNYSGIKEKSALINEALKAYVAREASRRLAKLGGTMPGFEAGPRKRYFDAE